MVSKILTAALVLVTLGACSYEGMQDRPDEFTIGDRLQSISPMTAKDGSEKTDVMIFDQTTRMIRHFDTRKMAQVRRFHVDNPGADHYLLYHQSGNYVVDLTLKGLTIFDKSSVANRNPVPFLGTPQSAAFRPDLGYLVIYDNLKSVPMLKLDENGDVVAKWVGGPLLFDGETRDAVINAGDITDDGRLILALSDGSIANVDLDQTIAKQKWTFTRFHTPYRYISWVAPVHGQADQVLIKTTGHLALLSLGSKSVLSESAIFADDDVLKLSKSVDAHVVLRRYDPNVIDNELRVLFVQNSEIHMRPVHVEKLTSLLTSRLNLAADTWTLVGSGGHKTYWDSNDLNLDAKGRTLLRYRFSDLLATHDRALPDGAQLEITENSIFALFPNKLGYAVKYDLDDDGLRELRYFNTRDLGQ